MEKVQGSILVIDDNDINRRYVKTVLKGLSHKIILAESGSQGLKEAQKQKPDLILIDIQMPLMDGFQCYDKMTRELNLEAPILAITAYSDSEDRDRFITYGFDDYITKPVKPDVLKNTVQYWLGQFENKKNLHNEPDKPDLDVSVINDLKKYAKGSDLKELYNEFIEETKIFNDKLPFLQGQGDHTEILSILHTIKGNAGSLGFAKLSELTSALEADLKIGNEISLSERIQEIIDYSSKVFNNYETQLNLNL